MEMKLDGGIEDKPGGEGENLNLLVWFAKKIARGISDGFCRTGLDPLVC